MEAPHIAIVLLGLGVAVVLWKVLGGGLGDAEFVIRVQGPDSVQLKGTVPGRSESDVIDFVSRMELPRGAKIWGVRDHGQIRLRFSSSVPENLQQRTRNYLYV